MTRAQFPVVVHVLVVRGDSLFLLRRANTGFMDGFYALPGGHQESGESVSQAARRECEEEVAITPLDLTPVCVMPYRSGRHQGLNFVFETLQFRGEPINNEPDLFDVGKWVQVGDLPRPHADWLPRVLEMRGGDKWYAEFEWD